MGSLLLKNVKLIKDTAVPFNTDILIQNGRIKSIQKNIDESADEVIDKEGLYVSNGWVDIGAFPGEPGYEERETLQTLSKAASAGGFTHLVLSPQTDPPVDNSSMITRIENYGHGQPLELKTLAMMNSHGSLSDLSEIYDLVKHGAAGFFFSPDELPRIDLLSKALRYSKISNVPVFVTPLLKEFNFHAVMHEGKASVHMGVEGLPEEAEIAAVRLVRDLHNYNGGTLVYHGLSAADSIDFLESSYNNNAAAGIMSSHLSFTEEDLLNFDPVYKVFPPFRTEEDRKMLIDSLKQRVVDYLYSGHNPWPYEITELEFGRAPMGHSNIETAVSGGWEACKSQLSIGEYLHFWTKGPDEVLLNEKREIIEGAVADLTLFRLEDEWKYEYDKSFSKGRNNPWESKSLSLKVIGTIFSHNKNIKTL